VTAAHFIYIPMVLTVGTVLGFFLGGRAARDALAMQQKKDERRAEAKAARQEAREKARAEAAEKKKD
jgi:hypothetical protein